MPISSTNLIIISSSMAAAALIDLRSHKIPNLLTYSSIIVLLLNFSIMGGLSGFMFSAQGLLLGTGLLLPLYMIGGMGAGDAKLMGVAGAALGASGVFTAFLFTAIAGGIYAAGILLLKRRSFPGAFSRLLRILTCLFFPGRPTGPAVPPPQKAPKLCYGIPIAIGTAGAIAWQIQFNSYLF